VRTRGEDAFWQNRPLAALVYAPMWFCSEGNVLDVVHRSSSAQFTPDMVSAIQYKVMWKSLANDSTGQRKSRVHSGNPKM